MDGEALIRRVRGEFLEMPGLKLTVGQAARLWGLRPAECEAIIAALVDADFLRRTACGAVALSERA